MTASFCLRIALVNTARNLSGVKEPVMQCAK
jgi:hypothetical protein